MTAPSRFTKVGLSGHPSTEYDSDSSLQTLVAKLPVVASASAQDITSITVPDKAIEVSFVVNVITAEATGLTKTIDIGINGGNTIIAAADVSSTGLRGRTGTGEAAYPQEISGATLTYTLGSNDFVELEAELIATFLTVE